MTDLYRIKELEWEQVGKVLQAALGFSSYTLVVIDGEWVLKIYTDGVKDTYKLDSEHQAKAAANEHHRKEVEKMLEPSPDRRLTTKEALANVDMEKVGLEASIEQLLVILEAKDMLLAEAANGLRDALGAFENNNAIDWDELEQTLSAIKQALHKAPVSN